MLGYRVIVCDAREVFATTQRFPLADEVIVEWPNKLIEKFSQNLGSRDAVCILTHDAKFDVPAIVSALTTEVGYIGVMGSRKTHEDRTNRLFEVGVTAEEIESLFAPLSSLKLLETFDILDDRFRNKGLTRLLEHVFLIVKN